MPSSTSPTCTSRPGVTFVCQEAEGAQIYSDSREQNSHSSKYLHRSDKRCGQGLQSVQNTGEIASGPGNINLTTVMQLHGKLVFHKCVMTTTTVMKESCFVNGTLVSKHNSFCITLTLSVIYDFGNSFLTSLSQFLSDLFSSVTLPEKITVLKKTEISQVYKTSIPRTEKSFPVLHCSIFSPGLITPIFSGTYFNYSSCELY